MSYTDVHVHLAALPTKANGALLSPRLRKSFLTKMVARNLGLDLDDPEGANRLYLERLGAELAASRRVSRAVLLAMDGAYDASGRLDEAKTDFLIPNDLVLDAAASSDAFLAGVSINPLRRDALDEVERCADRGAVLVKVLPNAQCFDPADARCRDFYKALARRGLALLSHVGFEFSLLGQDQSAGDPARLRVALDEGVTAIAAHGCSTGLFVYEKYLDTMRALIARYPRFYVDASALTLPNRAGALWRLAAAPGGVVERLLFGTDYPLPVYSFPALKPGAILRARAETSRFDRQAAVLDALGLAPRADFASLARLPPPPVKPASN